MRCGLAGLLALVALAIGGCTGGGSSDVTLLLEASPLPSVATAGDLDRAIDEAVDVLRRRLEAAGAASVRVERRGDAVIEVGVDGIERDALERLLGRRALLRFCERATVPPDDPEACGDAGEWRQASGVIDGVEVALTGRFLARNAFVALDTLGNPALAFELEGDGPELLGQITSRLLGRRIGVFLDEELLAAPTVQSVIRDRGQITGLTSERAREVAVQLNSGSLPVALTVLEE